MRFALLAGKCSTFLIEKLIKTVASSMTIEKIFKFTRNVFTGINLDLQVDLANLKDPALGWKMFKLQFTLK